MKRIAAVTLLFCLLGLNGEPSHSASLVDESIKQMVAVQMCQSPAEFECLESITLSDESNKSIDTKIEFGPKSPSSLAGVSKFEYQSIDISYSLPGVTDPKLIKHANLYANLKTQWIDMPNGSVQVPGFAATFINAPQIDPKLIFTIVFRSAWLRPQNVALYAMNANFKDEPIPGGHRYTMSGSKQIKAIFKDQSKYRMLYQPEGELLKADDTMESFSFLVDHAARYSASAYPLKCEDQGYPVASSNASSAGQPSLKSADEIQYAIAAPHFLPSGEVFQGYFAANLSTKYLNCMWPGNEISKSSQFTLSITDDSGTAQKATTSVKFEDGIIYVRAYGFHYSAPTIKLKGVAIATSAPETQVKTNSSPDSPAVLPVSSTPKKPTTIVCVKGKSQKKIEGMSPKCPTGYKVKR